jgi:hypothetical protein
MSRSVGRSIAIVVPEGVKCAAAHVSKSQNAAEKPRIQKPLSLNREQPYGQRPGLE